VILESTGRVLGRGARKARLPVTGALMSRFPPWAPGAHTAGTSGSVEPTSNYLAWEVGKCHLPTNSHPPLVAAGVGERL